MGYGLFVGDIMTGALDVLQLQLLAPPPSSLAPIKSRIETFWYWLTHLENGCYLKQRERERDERDVLVKQNQNYYYYYYYNYYYGISCAAYSFVALTL